MESKDFWYIWRMTESQPPSDKHTLNEEVLRQFLDAQDELSLREHANFGIFQYGGDIDESFIKANQAGLQLYALQLLRASAQLYGEEKPEILPIEFDTAWMDLHSEIFLQYIAVSEASSQPERPVYSETFGDKVRGCDCMLFFILIVLSLLSGAATILNWFFG